MGASPDGLVVAATTDAAEYNADVLNSGDTIDSLNNNERGILEVKCPFNRGNLWRRNRTRKCLGITSRKCKD